MARRNVWMTLLVVLVAGQTVLASAQSNLAAKPPMGWNSWNHFADHVTDADVRSAAGMFNGAGDFRDVGVDLKEIGFSQGALLHDVWQNKDLGRRTGVYSRNIPGQGVALLILSK
jgi:hypothetical protein